MELEVILQHGWAFNAACWKDWEACFSRLGQVHILDRGYFGAEHDQKTPSLMAGCNFPNIWSKRADTLRLVVAHSLGLHLLPLDVLKQASYLVIIGGFANFHLPGPPGQASRKALALMKEKLLVQPHTVLNDFYKKCYYPAPAKPESLRKVNLKLLQADLALLDETSFKPQDIFCGKTIILHGAKDCIVSSVQAHQLSLIIPSSQVTIKPGSGHALPFTDTNWCIETIFDNLFIGAPEYEHSRY